MKYYEFITLTLGVVIFATPILAGNLTGVATVKDARTLVVDGETVELYGIDAVEIDQTCRTKREKEFPCGVVAAKALATVVRNVEVKCQTVGSGSPMKSVICRAGPMDVAEQQVLLGWAFADPKTGEQYRRAERAARVLNEGIWKGKFEYPWDWRKQHR
jgi:endonuclease YncB( thermonuclease family)